VTQSAQFAARIRIVLAHMPRLLRDLLRDSLERHPHVVVEEDTGGGGIGAIVARTRPDGVILGSSESVDDVASTAEITSTLFRSPRTLILLVSDRGTTARLHELLPTHTTITDVTPAGLGNAILSRFDVAQRRGA